MLAEIAPHSHAAALIDLAGVPPAPAPGQKESRPKRKRAPEGALSDQSDSLGY